MSDSIEHALQHMLREQQIPWVWTLVLPPNLMLATNAAMERGENDRQVCEQMLDALLEQRQVTLAMPADLSSLLKAAVMVCGGETHLLVRQGIEPENMRRILATLLSDGWETHLAHLRLARRDDTDQQCVLTDSDHPWNSATHPQQVSKALVPSLDFYL